MDLDIKQLLNGDINRLRYVVRYSTSMRMHEENVAEHSYYVSLYAMFIADWVQITHNIRLDMTAVLRRALLHDIDEAVTGDFQRPFKYSSPKLSVALEEAARESTVQVVNQVVAGTFVRASYIQDWKTAKDNSYEGNIIRLADFLSVLSYLYAQSTTLDHFMKYNLEILLQSAGQFDDEQYDFLRPLVDQARRLLNELAMGGPYHER